MTDIRVPTLGESVTEATIGRWFKQPGEQVAVDEPVVELETDKVTIEVPAPASGVLGDIAAKGGETVAVGALLGRITDGVAATTKTPPAAQATTAPPAAAPRHHANRRSRLRCASLPPRAASTPPRCPARARMAASPRATCWRRSSARRRRRPRWRNLRPPFKCVRRRPPTMPRARSG